MIKIEGKAPARGVKSATAAPAPATSYQTAADGSYWAIKSGPVSEEIRIAWNLGPQQAEFAHSGLSSCVFPTARKLMDYMRGLGWSPRELQASARGFARVQPTADGFTVAIFPTYAAAAADDKVRAAAAMQRERTRARIAEAIAPACDSMMADWAREDLATVAAAALAHVPDLKPCPFCRQSDLLEIIDWSNERRDGTEYAGDAVRCNRCDAISPVGAWQGATPAPAKGSEVRP